MKMKSRTTSKMTCRELERADSFTRCFYFIENHMREGAVCNI